VRSHSFCSIEEFAVYTELKGRSHSECSGVGSICGLHHLLGPLRMPLLAPKARQQWYSADSGDATMWPHAGLKKLIGTASGRAAIAESSGLIARRPLDDFLQACREYPTKLYWLAERKAAAYTSWES